MTSMLTPAAFAMTNNNVSVVSTISDTAENTNLGTLLLKEDSDFADDMKEGKSFTITLPSGIKLDDKTAANMVKFKDLTTGKSIAGDANTVSVSGDYTVTVTLPAEDAGNFEYANQQAIYFTPNIKVDGFDGGDIEATVDGMESGVTSGKYVLGRVATGDKTNASVVKVETIGDSGKEVGGIIRVEERYAGSLGSVPQVGGADQLLFKIKLPSNFNWVTENNQSNGDGTNTTSVSGIAGYKGGNLNISKLEADDNELSVYGTIAYAPGQDRGIFEIHPVISADSDAKFGDVEASVDGKAADIDGADLVIAKYADYSGQVKAVDNAKDVIAGSFDQELAKINIKEDVAGAFVDGRKIRVDFPSWAKVTKATFTKGGANATASAPSGTDSYYEFTYNKPGSGKAEFEIKFEVSAKANASGDIKATVSGKAGATGEAVLGKAITPATITADAKEVRVGVKDQPLSDIYVTETKDGAISDENGSNELVLALPDDVQWSSTPTVEVVEGNLDIDSDNISKSGNKVTIPVKSSSTKPSKIKISGGKVDLNRMVPEGNIELDLKGSAVAENNKSGATLAAGEFDQSTASSAVVARVVTPAPAEQQRTAIFKIGDTKLNLGGVESTMDVAPYIKNDRTYLPVRFVAQAVGVSESNIMFNADSQSVVIIKGDRVVKMTINSPMMTVNGVTIQMDTVPEIVEPGRVMLPVGWVAQALGISAKWDGATQTVTLN
nr:copper amine oxidase N-terminal domain-containing protein [Heliobacterium chlorum]